MSAVVMVDVKEVAFKDAVAVEVVVVVAVGETKILLFKTPQIILSSSRIKTPFNNNNNSNNNASDPATVTASHTECVDTPATSATILCTTITGGCHCQKQDGRQYDRHLTDWDEVYL